MTAGRLVGPRTMLHERTPSGVRFVLCSAFSSGSLLPEVSGISFIRATTQAIAMTSSRMKAMPDADPQQIRRQALPRIAANSATVGE